MRHLVTLSSELFKVPLEGLRTLWADRRFRIAVAAVAGALVAAVVVIAGVLQFWLFPRINDYRDELAARVARVLEAPVAVGHLHGEWSYLHPRFVLDDVVVFDRKHQPAVRLERIGATLSWWQMLTGRLGFRNLAITATALDFRRDKAGHLFLADLPLDGGGDFRADSLLEQGDLALHSARLSWSDAQRGAPTLVLRDVDFRLRSHDARHRLDVHLTPPDNLGAPFKGRLDWIGRRFSEWRDWKISADLKINDLDLAAWTPWVDYPVALSRGRGKLDLQLETTGVALTHAEGSVAINDLKVRLASNLQELVLPVARSEILFQNRDEGRLAQLKLSGFTFTDAKGQAEPASDLFIERQQQGAVAGENDRFVFRASRLDLTRLRELVAYLPVSDAAHSLLRRTQPSGILENTKVTVHLENEVPTAYAAKTEFKRLSVRSEDARHFVHNLSGKVDLTQGQGKLTLDSANALLAAPGILPINEVPLAELAGKISWQRGGDALTVKIKSLQLRNDELQAVMNGNWSGKLGDVATERERAGLIDMLIVFDDAKTDSAWKYVPLSASPDISAWMKSAISGGSVSDFRIEMAGPVWDMPFGAPVPGSPPASSEATGVAGKFYLGFKVRDLNVQYAAGYPALKKLDATFAMNQNRIMIAATDGMIDAMRFSSIKADMADVSAFENHLVVAGQAQGPTESVVRFLQDTPVAAQINHAADTLKAEGNGQLSLTLDLNLSQASDTKLNGKYTFVNNRVTVMPTLPPVSALNGSLEFTEASMNSTDLQGRWSGQPLSVRIATDAQGTKIDASGRANIADLRQFYDLPVFEQISGSANWQARMAMSGGQTDLTLTSDLRGVTSSLPEPFNKSAGATLPLNVSRRSGANSEQSWRMSLGSALAGNMALNSRGQVVRGRMVLGSGQVPTLNGQPGIQVESLRPFNLDYWARNFGIGMGGGGGSGSSGNGMVVPTTWTLRAPLLTVFGRRFQDFRATVQAAADRTAIQINSRELQGDVNWHPPGRGEGGDHGLLQGRLSRLDLTAATEMKSELWTENRSELNTLPDLSLRVDELFWQGTPWGRLSFRASNQKTATGQSWRVDPFQLEGPDLKFSGRLNWVSRTGSAPRRMQEHMTALDFKLNSTQVGNLLTKLGFPDTMKRGSAQLDGQVSWPSNPINFAPGILSGNFRMSAQNGQFAQMDPGVGRLLGLLSLQSLPQRLTLDFRDIFSDGLAFESINGQFDIRDGVMKTSDLVMDAPAARVLMRGEANLAKQTQDVNVTVRPALGNSVALGVTLVNPIAGAATFLTQRVLGDPLSRLFSYQYHITGTWTDPLVNKESATPVPATTNESKP